MPTTCSYDADTAEDTLETKRVATLRQAAAAIEDSMEYEHDVRDRFVGVITCVPTCAFSDMRFGHFVRELRSKNLWPTTELESSGIGSALETMHTIECTAPSVGSCTPSTFQYQHRCLFHCLQTSTPYAESCAKIKAKAKELIADLANICYECAMTGEVQTAPFCSHGQSKYRSPECETDDD